MEPADLVAPLLRQGWQRQDHTSMLHGRAAVSVAASRSPGARPVDVQVLVMTDAGTFVLHCDTAHLRGVATAVARRPGVLNSPDVDPVLADAAAAGAKAKRQGQWKPPHEPAQAPAGEPLGPDDAGVWDLVAAHGWWWRVETGRPGRQDHWLVRDVQVGGGRACVEFDCGTGRRGRGYRLSGPAERVRDATTRLAAQPVAGPGDPRDAAFAALRAATRGATRTRSATGVNRARVGKS